MTNTTIQITTNTRKQLQLLGTKSETYDDIIVRLMENQKK
jgi:hypothetical protein